MTDTLAADLRESVRINTICAALKRDDLHADILLRRLVTMAYDECSAESLELWDCLVRFAEVNRG